ncbi:MAG: HyaD/HybD family hydrogenase maturation endopeptidase [Clostridiales bacterium]|nr:HyaD/HybD family hydrogenase maturation endopeptidase [Clostridiales bacterium]
MTERTLILGIGNPLMSDEGAGVRVAELLMNGFDFPDGVEVVDAGTMGLGMLNMFRDTRLIVVVDAIDRTGHPPGTVVRLTPEDLAPNQIMHSLHDIRFVDVLQAAELCGLKPDAECVGIQVGSMEQWVTELTPEVEAALPTAVDAVITILAERGVSARQRTSPAATDDGAIISAIRTKDQMPSA